MMSGERADWQLPPGVSAGTWDYVSQRRVATDYDRYFSDHPLLRLDARLLEERLSKVGGGLFGDFGCGSGRALQVAAGLGFDVLGVDLSTGMLQVAQQKLPAKTAAFVRANLVELDGFASRIFDAACCLFSTLGMIRGRHHRQRCLSEMHRVLKPGAPLILHVHNYWYFFRLADGKRWMLQNAARRWLRGTEEIGDRDYPYRGVQHMYLHAFRWRELRADLLSAGFRIEQKYALNPDASSTLAQPSRWQSHWALGWILVVTAATTT